MCSLVISTLGARCVDQTTDGGGRWSSCRRSSSHLRKHHVSTGGGAGAGEMKNLGAREEKVAKENGRERAGSLDSKWITPTRAVSANRRRRKVELKSQNGGEGENEKKITLGDGSVVFECPTPTPTSSGEQEEELSDWIKGGEAEEGKYCLVKSLHHCWGLLMIRWVRNPIKSKHRDHQLPNSLGRMKSRQNCTVWTAAAC